MKMFVESSFEVFDFVGGPFDGEALLRSTAMLAVPAHCESPDGLVHRYSPAGLSMLYEGSYQAVKFASKNEVPLMQNGAFGTSSGLVDAF